jgi:hypothetical protein
VLVQLCLTSSSSSRRAAILAATSRCGCNEHLSVCTGTCGASTAADPCSRLLLLLLLLLFCVCCCCWRCRFNACCCCCWFLLLCIRGRFLIFTLSF